ncbi:GAF domain-containing protein [Streptomyces mutabilis]|uniref:sensor histidine kinase n=1 Tax=Streptomyces TaxID=1883 RepID=UPI000BD27490|nr:MULTISPECIES: GAF domain-containing protein [unclassified Streptomyces]MDN3250289.1 GAF domain-containing protein [Streptomyces sp. ZSW22]PAK24734.1 histidine kinase [Streptomyces sp. alain-838]
MSDRSAPRLTRLLEAVLEVGTDLDLRGTLQRVVDGAAELTGASWAELAIADPARGGLAEIRTPGRDGAPEPPPRLRVPIHVGDEEFGELRLAGRSGGGPFTAEDEQSVRVLATQAGIAIGNARLYETARRRERWIEGAAAVTNALLTEENAGDALTTVAERARLLADATAGVILQPTAEGGMEIVTASTPEDPDGIVGATIAPGSPVLEQLLGGEPVFVTDSATDPRMTTHVRHRFGPSMLLPLRADGRLIGTLALPRRRGDRPYTAVEGLLATQFASQAALALVLADARRGRERLAVYEDRDRIARDLHDLVVQRLFATGMMLESTQRRPGADDVRDVLDRAVDELRSTVREVRTTILALRQPPAGPPTGLRGRVLRETASAAARLGFPPSTHFTGAVDTRVPDRVGDRLLSALRQALSDTAGRPDVTRVEVVVDASAASPDGREGVRLTVLDDGGSAAGGDGGDVAGTTFTWWAPL